ncbi:MAG: ParB/RepB/Spo0J family partition protein, partial [Clostridia bacterium]
MDTPNNENLSFDKTLPQDTTLPNAMSITQLDISLIVADSDQPRKVFNQNALDELASSIKNYGVLQPVIVTKCGSKYKLVAGERRYRASLSAGLATIPAIVKEFSATEKQEVALIENLQRENLNPIEEARAYKALMEDFDFTQEELATRLGKSRPVIANSLRLLTLPLAVRDMVTAGRLSQGHARCLVAIKDAN